MDGSPGRHGLAPLAVKASRHSGPSARGYGLLVRRSGRVLAATISAALLVGTGYAAYNYNALTTGQQTVVVDGLGGPRPSTAATASTQQHVDGSAENILIVGDDSRAGLTTAEEATLQVGSDSETTSTDTLLLVHVPGNGKKATMISIPRDSYVDIPGFKKDKINAAYIDGYDYTSGATTPAERQRAGVDELVATVKELTGVTIDHYVQVGFEGFEAIAKAIGGVTVDLCHAVNDTAAYNLAHGISGGSGFEMSAGVHKLTPVQTLEFVRQRHNLPGNDGDIGREARQRYFLSAAFTKILTAGVLLNPIRLHNLVNAINGAFVTDQGFQLLDFAQQMSDLSQGNITGETIPYTNGPTISGVGSVLLVDPTQVQLRVQQLFYGASPVKPTTPAATGSPSPTTPSGSSSAPTIAPVAAPACIN